MTENKRDANRALHVESLKIYGVYPILRDNKDPNRMPPEYPAYATEIKTYLEARSGFSIDLESTRYIIEEWRLDPKKSPTIYGYAVTSGLLNRLRIKP